MEKVVQNIELPVDTSIRQFNKYKNVLKTGKLKHHHLQNRKAGKKSSICLRCPLEYILQERKDL